MNWKREKVKSCFLAENGLEKKTEMRKKTGGNDKVQRGEREVANLAKGKYQHQPIYFLLNTLFFLDYNIFDIVRPASLLICSFNSLDTRVV